MYPVIYAQYLLLTFLWKSYQLFVDSCDLFTHIVKVYSGGIEAIAQRNKPLERSNVCGKSWDVHIVGFMGGHLKDDYNGH